MDAEDRGIMANYTLNVAKHATLSGTTVDVVTTTTTGSDIEVLNRGTTDLFVTFGNGLQATEIANPTTNGDDTVIIPAGYGVVLPDVAYSGSTRGRNANMRLFIKVLGNANPYTIWKHG